jgi:hypothetical protein
MSIPLLFPQHMLQETLLEPCLGPLGFMDTGRSFGTDYIVCIMYLTLTPQFDGAYTSQCVRPHTQESQHTGAA